MKKKTHVTLRLNPNRNVIPLYGHTATLNGAVARPNNNNNIPDKNTRYNIPK
jgi:hypothetical protein